MPELPDVEVFKKYLESTALHKKITGVDVLHNRVLEDITPQKLQERFIGSSFTNTDRRGKYLFVHTEKKEPSMWLVLHFGMTGYLKYYKDEEEKPKHVRVLFNFENGYHLAYICQRLLGKVAVTSSPENYINKIGLGIDASEISLEQFKEIFDSGGGTVKSLLMNQNMIAGLGNIYADEVLFQAGIHPKTGKKKISENDIETLFTKMKYVFKKANDIQAKPEEFPRSFLIPRREEGKKCPKCGGSVEKTKVAGRGSYFCPDCQKIDYTE